MDELEILIKSDLNVNQSIPSINKSIEKIEKKINKLKLQATLDNSKSKAEIQKQIETLNKQKKKLYVDLKLRKNDIKKQILEIQKEYNLLLNVDTANAQKQIKNVSNTMGDTKNETVGLGLALKNAFSNAGFAISAQSALQLVRKAANEATQAVKEYDQYATNLSIITGGSRDSSNKIIGDLAEKSLNFKVDISDLEGAAETLLRTGKTIDETNKYLENTVYLSKLGFQDMDTSASQLVTIGNAYEYTADEMGAVVDKFAKLDSSANVTAGNLAEGVAKSAQNAKLAGFNIDQLSASIAGLKDITGNTESQIANSLNMIFSRLQNVKLGKFIIESEDGTEDITQAINDTEKLLNTFNIKLRDSKNEFRDIGELFTELSDNWDKFNSVQQSAIATTIAGARQRNTFIALIENWNKIQELTDVSLNSMGTAVQKYDSYLQSIEAKSAAFSTATKELWNNLVPDGLVGNITDAGTAVVQFTDKYRILQTALKSALFYGFAKGVVAAKNSFAGMVTDIKNVSYAMNLATQSGAMTSKRMAELRNMTKVLTDSQLKLILSNSKLSEAEMIKMFKIDGVTTAEAKQRLATLGLTQANQQATTATFSLSGAFKSLRGVIAANPVMAFTMAVAGIATIYQTVKRKNEEMRESAKDSAKELNEQAQALEDLRQKYIDIVDSEDSTAKKTEELNEWKKTLIETYGLEKEAIEQVNLAREDGLKLIDDEIAKQNRENRGNWFGKNENQFNKAMRTINDINYSSDIDGIIQTSIFKSIDANEVRKSVKDLFNNVYEVGAEGNWQFEVFGNNLIEKYENIQKIISELGNSKDLNFSEQNLLDGLNKESENIKKILDNYQEIYETGYNFKAMNYFEDYASNNPIENIGKDAYLEWKKGLISTADNDTQLEKELTSLAEKQFPDYQKYFDNLETAKDKFVVGKVNSKPISDFINSLSDDDLSILIQLDTNIFKNGIEDAEQAIENFKNDPDNQISIDVETGDTSSLDDLEKSYEELSKSADSYAKSQKTLTDALKEQKEHGQLSADTIKSLSEAGYSQALAADKETGAVTLNMEAYNRLNEQKKLKIKLDIEQQNTELETQLQKEESAISSLKMEYEALANANAQANAERLKAIEIELAQRSQNKSKLQGLVDKNNSVSISLDAPTFDTSSTKTDAWKETAEKKFADLEHLYAMDKISYSSYLNQLDKLNQYYYGNNEKYLDEFRKNEEKVYQGRKKLNEDLIAEEEKQQKAYHDKRISELETQITVTTKNSVDDQGNKLIDSEKFDYIRDIYDEILAEIERRENEIVQSGVEVHEDELAELIKLYEEYANKKSDIFNDEIQQEMDYISNLEKKYNDFIDKRIDRYEDEKKAIEDKYDAEIKSIDDTINALKDNNDVASKSIELKKALQNLENAKQRTRMVYGSDGTIAYRQDTEKIEEAQQKVDDLKLDMLIDSLEKQKEAVEGEKETALNKYDTMIDTLNEQKDKQSNYYNSLLEILNAYLNPNANENLDTVFERIFADKNNVKTEDGTTVVNGNVIDTSNVDSGKLNGDKVNDQLKPVDIDKFMKDLYAKSGTTPDAYDRWKCGEFGDPFNLLPNLFSYNNIAQNGANDIIKNITENRVISNSQPASFSFGDINITNPVGDAKQLAEEVKGQIYKEAMMELPNAFQKQMYTNLK